MAGLEQSDLDDLLKMAAERPPTDPIRLTVRELLVRVGAKRRGSRVVTNLDQALASAGLRSDPPYTDVWIDANVSLVSVKTANDGRSSAPSGSIGLKVGSLASANRPVASVHREDTISRALSLMELNDYSQLAVVGGPRQLHGAVTWRSITEALVGIDGAVLKDALVLHPPEVHLDEDLLPLIPRIARLGFAFVRARDNALSGIVTTDDLSSLFGSLAEPYLALEEVERRLRVAIASRFDLDEVRQAVDPAGAGRIEGIDDLTLGEVVRFLQKPENFDRFGWYADRAEFMRALEEIRVLRNDLVHFSPDPPEPEQLTLLQNFNRWLRDLHRV
jgi:restriction system protein